MRWLFEKFEDLVIDAALFGGWRSVVVAPFEIAVNLISIIRRS